MYSLTFTARDINCTFATRGDSVFVWCAVLTVVTGVFSILGCVLVLFTYVAYKSLRTKGRSMLCHLSIADLIIVFSHIAGLWNFKRFINDPDSIPYSNKDGWCVSQAALTLFGTVSTLLWSNAIGFFMLVVVVSNRFKSKKIIRPFYLGSIIVCWIIPAVIVAANATGHYLGFHTIGTADCYIINVATENNSITTKGYQLAEIFSYEIWAYLSFLLLPVLYIATFYYTYCKMKNISSIKTKAKGHALEMKLILVPLIFVLLRVWSLFLGIHAYFTPKDDYICREISVIVLLIDTIGINGQGIANGILFCIFTAPVRKRLKKTFLNIFVNTTPCCKHPRWCSNRDNESNFLRSTTRLNDSELPLNADSQNYNSISN